MNRQQFLSPTLSHLGPMSLSQCKVLAFPHAGGDLSTFRELASCLAEHSVGILAVRLPGRGSRWNDAMPGSVQDLIDEVLLDLKNLDLSPRVLLGQSMGAVLAFELSCQLLETTPTSVVALSARDPRAFNASVVGPDRTSAESIYDSMYASALAPVVDSSIAEDLRWMALKVLRKDLALLQSYRPTNRRVARVTCVRGEKDASVTGPDIAGWRNWASWFDQHEVPGGHLILRSGQSESTSVTVAEIIAREVQMYADI